MLLCRSLLCLSSVACLSLLAVSLHARQSPEASDDQACSRQVAGRTQTSLTMLDMSHSGAFSDGGMHLLLLAPALLVLNAAYCPRVGNKGIRRLCCSRASCSRTCRYAKHVCCLSPVSAMGPVVQQRLSHRRMHARNHSHPCSRTGRGQIGARSTHA
jgi:hypothetical protein